MNKHIPSILFVLLLTITQFVCAQPPKSYGLWTVDISPDDKYIATGGDDSVLKIYNGDFTLYKWIKLGTRGMIRHLSWHPKEKLLGISTRHSIWIVNPETGEETILEGNPGGSRAIGWNYNGQLFAAAAGSGMIWIWNKQGKLLRKIQKFYPEGKDTKDIIALDWHPSKNILLSVGDEVRIHDTSGKELNMFKHRERQTLILTAKWHPSGDFFVTGDYGHPKEGVKTLLQFWKADGTLFKEWTESIYELRQIRWNKQGTWLATGSDALRIWSKEGELLHSGDAGGDGLWGVDWTSNSDKVVTVSFAKGSIKSWNNKAKLLSTYP